jgi:hypothetical protein
MEEESAAIIWRNIPFRDWWAPPVGHREYFVGEAVTSLASEKAKHIVGAFFPIDGEITIAL